MSPSNPQNVFISYAHEDRLWRARFEDMFAPARDRGIIGVWSDADIEAGANWDRNIHSALDGARVGLLLVSDHFLNSPFITKVELTKFLASAKRGGVSIRWVPISASLYTYSDLAQIQAAWDPEKPLESLSEAEQKSAIQKICLEIVERFGAPAPVSQTRRGNLRANIEARLSEKYVVIDELAAGKFSIVYRAERKFPKRQVVVKALVASELDDWARRAFKNGIERAWDLTSPAFIKVLDHSLDDSPECIVSEFIQGERLTSFLWKNESGLPLQRVKSIVLDLARAINEAHVRGWRRGELCPSDILIDASGIARISPIDVSNLLREEGQVTGNFLVDRESMSYMTPERFYGTPPGLFSDQYSLGLIATELLGGGHIPRVLHPSDLVDKPRLFANLESGKGAWAERSPEMAGVVSRMLRKDPAERWPSMAHVLSLFAEIDVDPDERLRRIATAGYLRLQSNNERLQSFFGSFYKNFRAADSEIDKYFQARDMERQHRFLNQAIHALLEFQLGSPTSEAEMIVLASRHATLGLKPQHYDLFLDAFVKTVDELPGRDPAEPQAWRIILSPGIKYIRECVENLQIAAGS